MKRKIVQPPVPGELALAELKQWLGITRPSEDAMLAGLIDTSVALCEAFTGIAPLRETVEEIVPLAHDWRELASQPVTAITDAALIAGDGTRTAVANLDTVIEYRIAGSACVRVIVPTTAERIALTLTVGVADAWESLPAPLRHGIIRLAAHFYRDRDGKPAAVPPASVTALWRPWRTVRLA